MSAVGILIMPPRGRLSALSLNDICINLIHPHIYMYPRHNIRQLFLSIFNRHHPSTSTSRTIASTSPALEIMRPQGGRIALSLNGNDMWINFIHPHYVVCLHIVNASFIFVIMRPQGGRSALSLNETQIVFDVAFCPSMMLSGNSRL